MHMLLLIGVFAIGVGDIVLKLQAALQLEDV